MFDRPVIIIGAPRSGTSLIQKIIREHPSFISVPRESDMIWNPYCHPKNNHWDGEGINDTDINTEIINTIRDTFNQMALPAATWQRWSQFNLMAHPLSAAIVRKLYQPAFNLLKILRKVIPRDNAKHHYRLVDKSVHCPLWLNLVEAAFPDALYIHITRDGLHTVDSMLDGWLLESKRFNTYHLSELNIQGYAGHDWNFALPYGWRDYTEKSLEQVVAFQWCSIQNAILSHLDSIEPFRSVQVKLEDLTAYPTETLQNLSDFMNVPNTFAQYEQGVPVMNASPNQHNHFRYPVQIANIANVLEPLQKRLGY